MNHQKKHFRLIFIFSVFILLLNDHFLKDFYGNDFTGKLSDFAGLFAFPYFLSLLFPNKIKFNYIFSGLFFIFWKLEFIEPLLNYFQSIGIGVNRTIDYSDLIALTILPISYIYWYSDYDDSINLNKFTKPIVVALCTFAFIATSMPKQYGNLNLKVDVEVILKSKKEDIISKLNLEKQHLKYILEFKIPEQKAKINALIILKDNNNGLVSVKLDSILDFKVNGGLFIGVDEDDVNYIKKLKREDFEKIFLQQELPKLYEEAN